MAEYTNKFLSQDGLAKFWKLIKTKFVADIDVNVTDAGAAFTITKGDGTKDTSVVIPAATTTTAGIMTAAQAQVVDNFKAGVDALIPFTALKVSGTSTTLTNRAANIDLVYDSVAKQIQLVDLNKMVDSKATVLTSIDATDFIKDGMLESADIIVKEDGKTVLRLTWNSDGNDQTDIDVSDMFLPYGAAADGGLSLVDRVFAIKLAAGAEGDKNYLKVDANGLATTGIDTAIATAADKALTDAKTHTNTLIGGALGGDGETKTVKGYVDAASAAAQQYTNGKIAEVNKVIEENEKVTSESLNDLNTRVGVLEAIDHDKILTNAKAYTDDRLGAIPDDTTVKGYVDAEVAKANGVAITAVQDVVAGSTYVAVTRPTEGADVNKVTVDLAAGVKTKIDGAVQSVTNGTGIAITGDGTDVVVALDADSIASLKAANSAVQTISVDQNQSILKATRAEGSNAVVLTLDLVALSDKEIEDIVNGTNA